MAELDINLSVSPDPSKEDANSRVCVCIGPTFHSNVTLAVPKGRLYDGVRSQFMAIGIELPEPEVRQYFFKDFFGRGKNLFIAKPKAIPQLLDSGLCRFGICGNDIMEEYVSSENLPIRLLADLKINQTKMVAATMRETDMRRLKRPAICATEFPNIASRYLTQAGIPHYILNTGGSTEGYVHLGADLIVDVCETGNTIKTNNLKICETILSSSTCLFGIAGTECPDFLNELINHI